VLGRDTAGNLYVDTVNAIGGYCTLTSSSSPIVAPLSMTNKAAMSPKEDIVTQKTTYGTENQGLLATVWGKVSNVFEDGDTANWWFDLDDGSGTPVAVCDYYYGGSGDCLLSTMPAANQYWKATGIIAYGVDPRDSKTKRTLILDCKNAVKIPNP
jgi:hypothetical protein